MTESLKGERMNKLKTTLHLNKIPPKVHQQAEQIAHKVLTTPPMQKVKKQTEQKIKKST